MKHSNLKLLLSLPILVTALILNHGCSSSDRQERPEAQDSGQAVPAPPYGYEGLTQTHYDVDPVLLGFTYEDSTLGLRFAPPRGWAPVEERQFERVRGTIGRFFPDSGPFRAIPERIFIDEGRMIFMIVATLDHWPSPESPFSALPDYRAVVDEAMPDMSVQADLLQSGEIGIYQLNMSNDIAVNRRLILIREGHLPVRVDYIAPRKLYEDLAVSIDASIGSFRPLDR